MSQTAAAQKTSKYSTRILVVVERDMTAKVSKVIWAHELPLLEEIHGEGNVAIIEGKTLDDGYTPKIRPDLLPYNKQQDDIVPPSESANLGYVFIGDPESEFQRLTDAYGRSAEENISVVERVYGRYRDGRLRNLLKTPKLADLPINQLKGLVKAYGVDIESEDTQETLLKKASEAGVEL